MGSGERGREGVRIFVTELSQSERGGRGWVGAGRTSSVCAFPSGFHLE